MDAILVFPNQLFVKPRPDQAIFLLEDERFFDDGIRYHKHKIMLHKASMRAYFDNIEGEKHLVAYPFDRDDLKDMLSTYDLVYAFDPVDHVLKDAYDALDIIWLEHPDFMTDTDTIRRFFKGRSKYVMHDFYVFQRKRMNILMENGQPMGGKYSFDVMNREKLPESLAIPPMPKIERNAYVDDAARWTDAMFPDNPGDTKTFDHPVTRHDALQRMRAFFKTRFQSFGPYQDALSERHPILFHSALSSSINIGLLSPHEVVRHALDIDAPLASKEGFIRQIIGWREFVRAIYVLEGKTMADKNVLSHTKKMSDAWMEGQTGIPVVDLTIRKLMVHAYTHHIERLMVLGNLMMLSNIDPMEVYTYFMATHIDAYHWVMAPNIFGMSQFSAGALMTTKPYFSGSNYLVRMGVKKGDWTEVWDALFYLFLFDNRTLIGQNPRLGALLRNLERKSEETMARYAELKNAFLGRVTTERGERM
jgi:deoxyribodipyrimidine photolyase-related protein